MDEVPKAMGAPGNHGRQGKGCMRPASVTVLGHKVRIVAMTEQFDDNVLGYCDVRKESIYINPKLAEGAWQSTLCHEYVHYISDSLGLDMTEVQVSGVGTALYCAGVRFR